MRAGHVLRFLKNEYICVACVTTLQIIRHLAALCRKKNWFGGLDVRTGPVREYLWGNLIFCQTFS